MRTSPNWNAGPASAETKRGLDVSRLCINWSAGTDSVHIKQICFVSPGTAMRFRHWKYMVFTGALSYEGLAVRQFLRRNHRDCFTGECCQCRMEVLTENIEILGDVTRVGIQDASSDTHSSSRFGLKGQYLT